MKQQTQTGSVLVVALIFLIVLTLLGLNAINSTVVESKLATNNQARIEAFQMAEAGLLSYSNLVNNQEIYQQLKANGTIDENSTLMNGDTIIMPVTINGQALTDDSSSEIIYKGDFTPARSSDLSQVFSSNLFNITYFEVLSTGRNQPDGVVRTVRIRNAVLQTTLRQ